MRCSFAARHAFTVGLLAWATAASAGTTVPSDPFAWPDATRESRPGAYWWWMGSAVDPTNITRELTRYRDAGMGGVHIIPIYGAKGWEDHYLEYLSPEWMRMLRHTVTEAGRLGLNVDMTTGTGWCFGGPAITESEANASVVWQAFEVQAGEPLAAKLDPRTVQALIAFGPEPEHRRIDLTSRISGDATVDWIAPAGTWRVCAVSQQPSGQRVKRAAPGGEGPMLNLFSSQAMHHYLETFDAAFADYDGPMPRAQYHDSYEYRSDWAPDYLAQFEKRRGYRLQDELPALFAHAEPPRARARARGREAAAPADLGSVDADRAARVKGDYRETISDLMVEGTLPMWVAWAHQHGCLTRNEAHGSPGNWLDLYAVADIPETEMFHEDRNRLVSKFASSAAHVMGKRLVAAETGTWLAEHFTETLAEMKDLLDDLFLSGVNHVYYHGTCYSPDEAPWPGWLFYASYEMNPRNPVWRDVPALNAYATRCQSVLQSGQPDNDILLYWPLHDLWHNPNGLVRNLTVHARDWFEDQPIGQTASNLWRRGYAFDYVSDRQLAAARSYDQGAIGLPGGIYRAVVVPPCHHMPLETFKRLLDLATTGATVLFASALPDDVPGWADLEVRRRRMVALREKVVLEETETPGLRKARVGQGRLFVGDLLLGLAEAQVPREPLFDPPDLMCIRRVIPGGHYYFIANRSAQQAVREWIPLGRSADAVVFMEPLSGRVGRAAVRRDRLGQPLVRIEARARGIGDPPGHHFGNARGAVMGIC